MEGIDYALKISERSTHRRHMTGCVIMERRKREVVSSGWSHMGTWRMRELYSMHAELHALLRARHINFNDGEYVAYIATIARVSGAVTVSKPCFCCANALFNAGIRHVVFTVGYVSDHNTPLDCSVETHSIDLHDQLINQLDLKSYPAPNYDR